MYLEVEVDLDAARFLQSDFWLPRLSLVTEADVEEAVEVSDGCLLEPEDFCSSPLWLDMLVTLSKPHKGGCTRRSPIAGDDPISRGNSLGDVDKGTAQG